MRLLLAFSQINDRLEFPLELNMHPYTKEGRAATAATEEAAAKNGDVDVDVDVAGEDGIGDGDDDDVTEVSVWFLCLVATPVVEKAAVVPRGCCFCGNCFCRIHCFRTFGTSYDIQQRTVTSVAIK